MSILRKKGFKIWIYDPSHEQLTCNDPVITFKILFLELKFDINKICQIQMYSEMFMLIGQPPPALSPLNTLLNQPQDLGNGNLPHTILCLNVLRKLLVLTAQTDSWRCNVSPHYPLKLGLYLPS